MIIVTFPPVHFPMNTLIIFAPNYDESSLIPYCTGCPSTILKRELDSTWLSCWYFWDWYWNEMDNSLSSKWLLKILLLPLYLLEVHICGSIENEFQSLTRMWLWDESFLFAWVEGSQNLLPLFWSCRRCSLWQPWFRSWQTFVLRTLRSLWIEFGSLRAIGAALSRVLAN